MILLYLPVSAAYLGSAWLEWQRLVQPARTELHHRIAIASWLTACALIGHAFLVSSAIVTVAVVAATSVLSILAGYGFGATTTQAGVILLPGTIMTERIRELGDTAQ